MNLNSSAEQPPTGHGKARRTKKKKFHYFRVEFPHCNRIGRPDDGLLGRTYFICIAFTSAKRRAICEHNNRRIYLNQNFNIHFSFERTFFAVAFMWTNVCFSMHVAELETYCSEFSRRLVAWNSIKCALVDWRWISIFFWPKKGERRVLTTNGLMKIVHFIWMYSVSRSMTVEEQDTVPWKVIATLFQANEILMRRSFCIFEFRILDELTSMFSNQISWP